MTESRALAEALQRRRDDLNARVARAQALGRPVDGSALLDHLREVVAPLADAVLRTRAERIDAFVMAAFEVSLELMSGGLLGRQPRHPAIVEGWRTVLPAVPLLLAEQPQKTIAAVTNAIYNLSLQDGARPAAWVEAMGRIGRDCRTLEELRAAGHVVAWRCGMPEHRDAALRSCAQLPPGLALRCLGVDMEADAAQVAAALERLRNDPWLSPTDALRPAREGRLRIVATVSGFRGFGGAFLTPPLVERTAAGALVARDAEAAWLVTADLFGASLRRLDGVPPRGENDPRSTISADGSVRLGGMESRFDELRHASSQASDGTTLAVTVDRSHAIYLVGAQ